MPARFGDLQRALRKLGITTETGAKHFKVRNAVGVMYTIPAHNGDKSEITDIYIKSLCRNLGINHEDLKKLL